MAYYGSLNNINLDEISEQLDVNAVDVFVYDTSQDSDGGQWRHRCQHTSWYNEPLNTATRGSRREFPAVAVIVAEADKVTIYDGDDPALPMWMVANRLSALWSWISYADSASASSISAINGFISIGANNATTSRSGLTVANFLSDLAFRLRGNGKVNLGRISERNNSSPDDTILGQGIVNTLVNDVAMTVLPDAPIDEATGLPVPTIACLVAETEVLMADGSTKRMDQVVVGDVVKTLEGEHSVLNWWDQGIKDVVELEFDGGQKIICTADHKIRTTEGWVQAGDLTEDHEVIGL